MSERVTEPALLLPLSGGRSAMTCRYRCADACARGPANASVNEDFAHVLGRVVQRRTVLQAALAAGAAAAASRIPVLASRAADGLGFDPLGPGRVDDVVVPPGYRAEVVLRWGDGLFDDSPPFDPGRQTAKRQRRQFGYNNDYVAFLPLRRRRGLLVVNHEYANGELMFPDYDPEARTERQLRYARVEMAATGLSVVEVVRDAEAGRWDPVRGARRNRRVTARTRMRLTGPAAGHPLLRTSRDPEGRTVRGTLGNCAGGVTPWGTVLTCEENFDGYFVNGAAAAADRVRRWHDRYGIPAGRPEGHRRWDRVSGRFDVAREPHEPFRFGWVVELDPHRPGFVPRKRTALGRFKHEGAATTLSAEGRPVVYMGDDSQFEYVYKFVASRRMRGGDTAEARRHNLSLLDDGTLYVARFDGDSGGEVDGTGQLPEDARFDGSGRWIPLVRGDTSFVPGMTAAEVLINTRGAADRVGATKMDRPEDVERNPVTGRVYLSLTNNSARARYQVDEANPLSLVEGGRGVGNKYGHVLELVERDDDAAATRFRWRVFLLCGDPEDEHTYFAGYDKRDVSAIAAPDNLTFDAQGNLWIGTDGGRDRLGGADGVFACPTTGSDRGHLRRFLSVPVGAEATGPCLTPDQQTLFVSVQHPGEVDGATYDDPASTWPGGRLPRPGVVAVWKQRGSARIGS